MVVEIMLRQRSGEYALRIGTLRDVRIGSTVRIDGRARWVVVRRGPPLLAGSACRVECMRRERQRLAA